MDPIRRQIILSIVKFLRDECSEASLDAEQKESVDVARQCLETTYGVEEDAILSADDLKQYFLNANSDSEENAVLADGHKAKGNEYMKNDQQMEAIEEYTKAIQLNPKNSVYYCNRAAAYSRLEKNREAIFDCKEAIKLNPTYGKAFGRLGIAYSKLNMFADAKCAYAKALELDPANESYGTNLRLAEEHLNQSMSSANATLGRMFTGNEGGPGLGGVAGAPEFDLASYVRNPALVNMATQMLNEPSFRSLISGIISASSNSSDNVDIPQLGRQLAREMQANHPEVVESFSNQGLIPEELAQRIADQFNADEESSDELEPEQEPEQDPLHIVIASGETTDTSDEAAASEDKGNRKV